MRAVLASRRRLVRRVQREAEVSTDPVSSPDPVGGEDFTTGSLSSDLKAPVAQARRELAEAIRAAMPKHRPPSLVAALAVRLAQLGHAEVVSVKIAETPEAVQAVRSFLAERLQADAPRTTLDGLKTGQAGSGGSALKASVHKRTRACLECGRDFEVNPCHVKTHKYCRPACRARRHRRLRAGEPRRTPFQKTMQRRGQ